MSADEDNSGKRTGARLETKDTKTHAARFLARDLSWTRFPIVRLRYTKSKRTWTLYWRDRNLKFHLYEATAPTESLDELLGEIDTDRTAIFRG